MLKVSSNGERVPQQHPDTEDGPAREEAHRRRIARHPQLIGSPGQDVHDFPTPDHPEAVVVQLVAVPLDNLQYGLAVHFVEVSDHVGGDVHVVGQGAQQTSYMPGLGDDRRLLDPAHRVGDGVCLVQGIVEAADPVPKSDPRLPDSAAAVRRFLSPPAANM